MSVNVFKNPTQLAGSPGLSGDCGTREIPWTTGGARTATYLSGVAVDTLVFSGGGRLNNLIPLVNLVSGRGIFAYDGNIATSGGPFAVSGHRTLGAIPGVWHQGASGVVNLGSHVGTVISLGMPFFSGLIVAPGVGGSGTIGFCLSYTPDPNSAASGSTMV